MSTPTTPGSTTASQEVPVTTDSLSTTIPDPKHPESPWTVTDHQLEGETLELFIRRHFLRVQAVRDFLKKV